jgi:hypothetical protein
VKCAVETVGERWAIDVLDGLGTHRRCGAWPGRMSEARAQLHYAVMPILRHARRWPPARGTDFEAAARLLNSVANTVWLAHT